MPIRKFEFKKEKIYHIYHCGAKENKIFFDENDKKRFCQSIFLSNNLYSFRGIASLERRDENLSISDMKKILKNAKIPVKPLVKIFSFCLIPSHFHFMAKEVELNGISRFMQKLGNSFGKYLSKKYGMTGNIFNGRFKAEQISNNGQLKHLLVYINVVNPAQLVEPYLKIKGVENFALVWDGVEKYKWSSHQSFAGSQNTFEVDDSVFKKLFSNQNKYIDFSKDFLLGKEKDVWNINRKIFID